MLKTLFNMFKNQEHSDQYRLAQKAFAEHRYFEAVALFRTCLAMEDALTDEGYAKLTAAYYNLGLYSAAAQTLAKAGKGVAGQLAAEIRASSGKGDVGLQSISHHTYIRLKLLAAYIRNLYGENLAAVSILDVGGGAGYLACFLPDARYVLAEPTVNNISAFDLPFKEKSFDCVLASHVFEHIEDDRKSVFLDNLCNVAKSHVLLVNPFVSGDKYLDEIAEKALGLIWEITQAPWALEHIECGTPPLDLVRDYTNEHGYSLNILPNNSYIFTLLYVFMEYFANVAGKYDEFKKINQVFNGLDAKLMANPLFPNDFTCDIDVRARK